ncbi:MAG: NAD-glutamate dehydrogenase [Chromatiales bacterium]|nr:NAD-glutamate dehydrogenase [Chromatiales bacterium]
MRDAGLQVASSDLVDKVVAMVRDRLPDAQAELVEAFVRQFYRGVARDDLEDRAVEDLYGAAVAHWSFAKRRTRGEPKLRVYNPHLQQHGWQSTHTVLEVVSDDMPFLVDSVRMALNTRGLTVHLVIHPVMKLQRDADGRLTGVRAHDAGGEGAVEAADSYRAEAVMHFEIDRQTEPALHESLVAGITDVLADVRAAVEDWRAMRGRLDACRAELEATPPPLPATELAEGQAFLEWVDDNHFTFLGYRCYDLIGEPGGEQLRTVGGSGLGLLRDDGESRVSESFAALPPSVRAMVHEPTLLIVSKANRRSTVHRPSYMDYIGVKRFDAEGRVIGEHRFFGLYTSGAYVRVPRDIPMLREKVARVIAQAGYPPNSHASKALLNILETFPRDLLFQIAEDELFTTAVGILHLQERQRIRLFLHRDRHGSFAHCLVFVPREHFNTQARLTMQDILSDALASEDCDFTVSLSESVLARLYFVFRLPAGASVELDLRELETRLRDVTRTWGDELAAALVEQLGEEEGNRLHGRYRDAFRADYREAYSARVAVHDIEKMESLAADGDGLAMHLFRPLEAEDDVVRFKLFHVGRPIPLCDALPMLEHMGLRVEEERPARVKRGGSARVWIHDFGLRVPAVRDLDVERVRDKFQEAFARVWRGEVENDGFNRLVLEAGLHWREVVVLRAYCKYLRQAPVAFSQDYMEQVLARNAGVAARLIELFHVRLDPARADDREASAAAVAEAILSALDAVANLDEDRILRSFLGLVQATLRTNFYQRQPDGEPKSYVSFKLDPARVADLPEPRPMYEIFVYSPRVEGVHLRGGPVARGGIRWSDRREDFRTEVLGLVKAQMVKNAVIVPVGSKGGFFPKRMPVGADRETVLAEGQACYRIFIRGLLDVTDNLAGREVVPPPDVVRHDGDDPYLVVAADKGTATFSDIANAVAAEYGFWLGDAFASGGSQGYDHKGMGITARGGWESVKRHFRALGLDVQADDFTVVGVGDMSGDVFGNGMLLSEHIRLVGAFNHLHVFLDPNPDPAASFRERARLFALPRSSWDDYDRSLLSEGGGVFPRSAKSIPLSPEVQALLGVEAERLTPNEVIRALLRSEVDLLWNGGIGTYVKSTGETHDAVGDRANDAVRVDGADLRCRVVGEGGNLGFTQLGRIELALRGGRINTDAIDNSGGVDCSDHEVNIKVLLDAIVDAGDMTTKQRNELLAEMTDDVAELVLRNNYQQTQALEVAGYQAPRMLEVHTRLTKWLEREAGLRRRIERLPGPEELERRQTAGRGLTAPELSVLMAYVKIDLYQRLLGSDLSADANVLGELEAYFPAALRERFGPSIRGHRLSREIVSTVVANEIVNREGITFVFRMMEETGASAAEVAAAYLAARDSYEMSATWQAIEALDNVVDAELQVELLLEARKLTERATRWLLRNADRPIDVGEVASRYREGVRRLSAGLLDVLDADSASRVRERLDHYVERGVPEVLGARLAGADDLFSALDLVEVARAAQGDITDAARTYFELGARLDLHWLRDRAVALPRDNRWQALARASLREDIYAQQTLITRDVLGLGSGTEAVEAWMEVEELAVARCRQIMADLRSGGTPDFSMLSVAMREIRALRRPLAPAATATAPARRRARRTPKAQADAAQ